MELYSSNNDYKLYHGNMLDMLEVIENNTIDSIVTDPPYELNFMSKGWDNAGVSFQVDTWKKCYEVLKPGGYLLAFGGSRTFHRIACAIEDAGFEIRDTIMWLYGSGFPKSMDISKQIDKRADNNNEVIKAKKELGKWLKEKRGNRLQKEISKYFPSKTGGLTGCVANWEKGYNLPTWEIWVKLKKILDLDDRYDYLIEGRPSNYIEAEREIIGKMEKPASSIYSMGENKMNRDVNITAPSTELAKQWQGWGTALKPSFEPIIVARKPFKGSLVDNVIKNGVGGINIDECRVFGEDTEELQKNWTNRKANAGFGNNDGTIYGDGTINENNIKQYTPTGRFPANTILTYDETDFDEVCGGFPNTKNGELKIGHKRGSTGTAIRTAGGIITKNFGGDSGSASRYFYNAKASKKDRDCNGTIRNIHPTCKPCNLMQYLVRLVTPNNGVVLDPFNGSGSTGKAVMYENKERNKNYKYIGIEMTEEYLPISKARIEYVCKLAEEERNKERQLSIYDLQ